MINNFKDIETNTKIDIEFPERDNNVINNYIS